MKTAEEIWNDSVMVRTDEMNRRIEAAVLQEREACAKVCEDRADPVQGFNALHRAAAAIRARNLDYLTRESQLRGEYD